MTIRVGSAKQTLKEPTHRRFLSNALERYDEFIQGAQSYVQSVVGAMDVSKPNDFPWLYQKPFARSSSRAGFFEEMYQVLNLLREIELPAGARILEVGSGPGWFSEMLVCLGYGVDCLDPCADMNAVARQRVVSRLAHHHFPASDIERVRFHTASLEECPIESDAVDAVLFHESLHHIVDEERGLAECLRVLKPGGALGITGEAAWSPDNVELERRCLEEIQRHGTLENPFSTEYLTYLLRLLGFERITRYHSINGLFTEADGRRHIRQRAQFKAQHHQNVIAWKPRANDSHVVTTATESSKRSHAKILVHGQNWSEGGSQLTVDVELINTGETVWLRQNSSCGFVTVALFQEGEIGTINEATPRHRLSKSVAPGGRWRKQLRFRVPTDVLTHDWRLGLVNEGKFWFHHQNTHAPMVSRP